MPCMLNTLKVPLSEHHYGKSLYERFCRSMESAEFDEKGHGDYLELLIKRFQKIINRLVTKDD